MTRRVALTLLLAAPPPSKPIQESIIREAQYILKTKAFYDASYVTLLKSLYLDSDSIRNKNLLEDEEERQKAHIDIWYRLLGIDDSASNKRSARSGEVGITPRQLLIIASVIGVFTLGFFGYQTWQKEQQKKQLYLSSLRALEGEDWIIASARLQELIALDNNYRDTQNLLKEVYYRWGLSAFQDGHWEDAKTHFGEVMRLDPAYRDTSSLLTESYYQSAKNYIEAGNWRKAKSELLMVIAYDAGYKDTQALKEYVQAQIDSQPVQADWILYDIKVHVQPLTEWQGTGVFVHAGEQITISAEGEWLYCGTTACGDKVGRLSGPEGNCVPGYNPHYANAPDNALIGQIDSGQPFLVGSQVKVVADADGEIQLSNSGVTGIACFTANGDVMEQGGLEVHIIVFK